MRAQTATHRAGIAARLAAHGDVFHWRDAMFTAPVPLPRAALVAGDRTVGTAFAFLVAGQVLAVGARAPIAGVAAIAADCADDDAFAAALPAAIAEFWRHDVLPRGPLGTRPQALPDA